MNNNLKLINLKDSLNDVESVFDLLYNEWGSYFRKSKTEKIKSVLDSFQNNLKFPMFFIIKENKSVVGVFSFEECEIEQGNCALLRYVLIKPELRGKGYGNFLLECIDKTAKENFDSVYLYTAHSNFYEKIGYSFVKFHLRESGEINRLYKKIYN